MDATDTGPQPDVRDCGGSHHSTWHGGLEKKDLEKRALKKDERSEERA
jgi:hypothetical protein